MKTGYAIFISIFIAVFIMTSGLIIYIVIQGIIQWESEPSTQPPLLNASLNTQDIADESGKIYGQRGYVEITGEEMETITSKQLKEFADRYIKNSQFEWFSITTSNGSGIYFPDANYEYAEYGILSEDGRIESLYRMISLEGNNYVFHDVDSADMASVHDTDGLRNFAGADYEDDWFSIKFTAPEGYTMLSAAEMAELNDITSDILAEDIEYLKQKYDEPFGDDNDNDNNKMMCMAPAGYPNVGVIVDELAGSSMTFDQYFETSILLLEEASAIDWTVDDTVEIAAVAGREFKKAQCAAGIDIPDLGRIQIIQELYLTSKEDRVFGIILSYMADQEAEAAALLNAFQVK